MHILNWVSLQLGNTAIHGNLIRVHTINVAGIINGDTDLAGPTPFAHHASDVASRLKRNSIIQSAGAFAVDEPAG